MSPIPNRHRCPCSKFFCRFSKQRKKVTRFGTNSDELFHAHTTVKARSRGVWQNNAASIRGIFVALTTGYLRGGVVGGRRCVCNRCDRTARGNRPSTMITSAPVRVLHANRRRGSRGQLQRTATDAGGAGTFRILAKFHYTDPHGPARTFLRPGSPRNSVGPCGSPTKSVRVRAGPVGPV